MTFDSHCHFIPSDDIPSLLQRAREAGLCGLLAVGGGAEANEGAILATRTAPGFARFSLGFEPDAVDTITPTEAISYLESTITTLASEGLRPSAIGEIGIDYSREPSPAERKAQRDLFSAQLDFAARLSLPCTIHSRDAEADTIAILKEHLSPALIRENRPGSLHCFVGPASFAESLLPLNLCYGLSGSLTFRNADSLRAIAKTLPRDRILVETDSPYLAPVPKRGKTCEPAFVVHTARLLASLLELDENEAFALTARNALRLFP